MNAVVDVVGHVETSVVAARRHVGESFEVWNRQSSEKTVGLGIKHLDLFRVLPAQNVDVVVHRRYVV